MSNITLDLQVNISKSQYMRLEDSLVLFNTLLRSRVQEEVSIESFFLCLMSDCLSNELDKRLKLFSSFFYSALSTLS